MHVRRSLYFFRFIINLILPLYKREEQFKTLNMKISSFKFLQLLICLILLGLTPMFNHIAAQETRTITGTVQSKSDDMGIPGVNVIEKGTTNGTVTNLDGYYSITVSESSGYLTFSFVGMKTQEISIGNNSIIDVTMEEDIIGLDEVVAIGYGTVKKSDLTGAVGSVKSDEIRKVPVTSLDQSLQGRVAGVQIVQVSAQPGGNTLFRVRGGNSIYAGNEPLYVIDGMPVDSKENLSWISSPVINGLSALNPNDIESIEILKDASATSIYGARGANGVVLITTKRGKSGMDRVSFEAYYGIQEITRRIEVMDGSQYARLYDEAGLNAAIDNGTTYTPVYTNPDSIGEGTDWQDEIYRSAPMQNYQLSVSGGSPSTQYALSGNFFSQDGVITGSDFQRYSFRTNLDHSIREKLKVGTSFSVSYTKANTVGSSTPAGFFPGVVNTALTMSPALPIRDSTGQYTLTDPHADAWLDNPVAVTRDVKSIDKTTRFVGNIYANYTILKGLDLRVTLGLDQSHNIQDYYDPTYIYSGSFNSGQARFATTDFRTLLNENTLSYTNTFNDRHRINVLGGFSYDFADSRTFIDIATGYPNDRLEYYGIQSAENKPTIYTGFGEEALISYMGRINYSLDDKYLVTLTNRIDGSSKFGPNNRYANFPSVAAAWRLSSEEFIRNLTFIYNLKLRASIGISGNESIFNYLYVPTMGTSVYYFNNGYPATGYAPDRIGNDDLKWESTRQTDIGLDAAFIEGRISLTTDYYHKLTYDMLYYAEVPYTSGFSTSMLNVGSMVNNGFEFTLNTSNLVNAFKWNTDFSISTNKSRITDLNNNDDTYISDDTYKLKIGYWSVISVGEELGSFFGLESDGIWQLEQATEAAKYGAKPGDFKYIDQNNDTLINADDRLIIGHAQPDFIWSLNNTFSYKNFELTLYLQGVNGNDILNSNRFELESGNGLSNASIDMLNRWTPDNQSNKYPRANRNVDYLYMSDRYLEDGSYIRLQLLSLSYNMPAKLLRKAGIYGAKIYFSGKNLLTFTRYSGFDPEVGAFGTSNIRQGYDLGGYPAAKIYLVGFNIEF
jgi:TonB-linked SusC/RagA family outer membrane protein